MRPMPNIATALKAEIARVARKEVRSESTSSRRHRRSIARTLRTCAGRLRRCKSSLSPRRRLVVSGPAQPAWNLMKHRTYVSERAVLPRCARNWGSLQRTWERSLAPAGSASTSGNRARSSPGRSSCRPLRPFAGSARRKHSRAWSPSPQWHRRQAGPQASARSGRRNKGRRGSRRIRMNFAALQPMLRWKR